MADFLDALDERQVAMITRRTGVDGVPARATDRSIAGDPDTGPR